jgi:tRNA threonylcarbamoyl adenosine modification protein YeaZ
MKNQKSLLMALDATISNGSVSLWSGKEEIDFKLGDVSISSSEGILDNISFLLNRNNLKINDIDLLAISLGPGSYTGIRVGIATAQALITSTGCRGIGISSLEALAQEKITPVICLTGIWAGRYEIVCQEFVRDSSSSLKAVNKPQLLRLESVEKYVNETDATVILDRRAYRAIKKSNITKNVAKYLCASDKVARLVGKTAIQKPKSGNSDKILPIYAREFLVG